MTPGERSPQHDPDRHAAEQLVLAEMGWSTRQAAEHYQVYCRMVRAVLAGIHAERSRLSGGEPDTDWFKPKKPIV